MKNIQGRRPLAFEQMEQRLALSATATSDYVLNLGNDWNAIQVNGGSVSLSFDQWTFNLRSSGMAMDSNVLLNRWNDWLAMRGAGTSLSFDQPLTSTTSEIRGDALHWQGNHNLIGLLDGELVFMGPIYQPNDDGFGTAESAGPGSSVAPISQPQIGSGEIGEGIVAVAEIFRPLKSSTTTHSESPALRTAAVDTAISSTAEESWRSISLARGRDIHLEVATLSPNSQPDKSTEAELSHGIAPLIYQQSQLRREAERDSSTTSQDRVNSAEDLPTVPQPKTLPADAKLRDVPANKATDEKSDRTAQDRDMPAGDEFSQVADPRDQLFEVWGEDEMLSDEAIALRTDSQQSHGVTWPILAALATTGWFARARRLKGVLSSHRLPLRRKQSISNRS